MKAALERLSQAGAQLYQEAQAAASAKPEEPKKAEKKADVVDADFEVVDDDKNKA